MSIRSKLFRRVLIAGAAHVRGIGPDRRSDYRQPLDEFCTRAHEAGGDKGCSRPIITSRRPVWRGFEPRFGLFKALGGGRNMQGTPGQLSQG